MKTKTVLYSKVFSLGNFQNEKIEVSADLEPNEDAQAAMAKLRDFVHHNHELNKQKEKYLQCLDIMGDVDNRTGSELRRAKEFVEHFEALIKSSPTLIG